MLKIRPLCCLEKIQASSKFTSTVKQISFSKLSDSMTSSNGILFPLWPTRSPLRMFMAPWLGVVIFLIVLNANFSANWGSVKWPTSFEQCAMFVWIIPRFSVEALNSVCRTVSKCCVKLYSVCHIIMSSSCMDLIRVASTQSPVSFNIPGKILLAFSLISSRQPRLPLFSRTLFKNKRQKLRA